MEAVLSTLVSNMTAALAASIDDVTFGDVVDAVARTEANQLHEAVW